MKSAFGPPGLTQYFVLSKGRDDLLISPLTGAHAPYPLSGKTYAVARLKPPRDFIWARRLLRSRRSLSEKVGDFEEVAGSLQF